MADRISALQAEIESLHATHQPPAPSPTPKKKSKKEQALLDSTVNEGSVIARLRLDLAEALRSKGVSETRLRSAQEEVDRLQTRTKSNEKSIRTLELDNGTLTRKLKDRDHELREMRKLVEVRESILCSLISNEINRRIERPRRDDHHQPANVTRGIGKRQSQGREQGARRPMDAQDGCRGRSHEPRQ